jgi:hypothetical protein
MRDLTLRSSVLWLASAPGFGGLGHGWGTEGGHARKLKQYPVVGVWPSSRRPPAALADAHHLEEHFVTVTGAVLPVSLAENRELVLAPLLFPRNSRRVFSPLIDRPCQRAERDTDADDRQRESNQASLQLEGLRGVPSELLAPEQAAPPERGAAPTGTGGTEGCSTPPDAHADASPTDVQSEARREPNALSEAECHRASLARKARTF